MIRSVERRMTTCHIRHWLWVTPVLGHMRRIGLLGGMSWESSIEYYWLVNEAVRVRHLPRVR